MNRRIGEGCADSTPPPFDMGFWVYFGSNCSTDPKIGMYRNMYKQFIRLNLKIFLGWLTSISLIDSTLRRTNWLTDWLTNSWAIIIRWDQMRSDEIRLDQMRSYDRWDKMRSVEIGWDQMRLDRIRWDLTRSDEIKWYQMTDEIRWDHLRSD